MHILSRATKLKGRQTRLQTKLIYLYTMHLWVSGSGRNSRVDLFACKLVEKWGGRYPVFSSQVDLDHVCVNNEFNLAKCGKFKKKKKNNLCGFGNTSKIHKYLIITMQFY
ncbi:hypothetical protein EGR_10746 [Echinococcus granulosus]|uniref:Uncharacterized protein n=1 Tax=Echinococcus granulosus TaxID=6210 RepID=W6ULI3_ECHGR|nr:hypothetical protein EGR_10746 [Echinococcus granulosus]EUB54389.1 hypothetical protein EGR_10746 [Echinococcus granulosus]